MHCWDLMKDNPKFQDTKHGRNYRANAGASFQDQLFDNAFLDPEVQEIPQGDNMATPTSTAGKRPMGRDAAKRARKAASNSTAGSDFDASMHDLVLTRFTDNENNRKSRQDAYLEWKKEDKEEAKQDRKVMIEIEKAKLELEHKKLALREKMILQEQKKEDERILAMKLHEIEEPRRSYYAAMQKEILARINSRDDN